jgi:uncharacterized protein YqgC (DUF456 family)
MDKKDWIQNIKKNGHELFKLILGIVLIIGGIIGLFLPFLQGILMILAGLYLLGGRRLLKKLKGWLKRK